MKKLILLALFLAPFTAIGGSFTTMLGTDTLTASRSVINANFGNAISTSTAAVSGNLLYFSGVNTVANRATSTLTATSPVTVSNSPVILGTSGAVIECTGCSTAQWPFTQQTSFTGVSTSTLVAFTNGLMSIGSSTIQYFNSASSTITTLAIPSIASALTLTNGNGVFAAYAGTSCTNQFVRSLSALGAATCATVSTADVSGLDISDDTNLAVTSPIVLTDDTISCSTCAIFGYPFTTATTFTGVSTSTLIDFSGGIMSTASSTFQTINLGTITIPSITSSVLAVSQAGLVYGAATSTDRAFVFSTSTMGSGTTTLKVAGWKTPVTITDIGCTNRNGGTFVAQLGDSTSSTTAVLSSAGLSVTFTTISANNTFTSGESFWFDIGSAAGTVTDPSCSWSH